MSDIKAMIDALVQGNPLIKKTRKEKMERVKETAHNYRKMLDDVREFIKNSDCDTIDCYEMEIEDNLSHYSLLIGKEDWEEFSYHLSVLCSVMVNNKARLMASINELKWIKNGDYEGVASDFSYYASKKIPHLESSFYDHFMELAFHSVGRLTRNRK